MIFVTAHTSPIDITAVRQGWMVEHCPPRKVRQMVGESGEIYRVFGSVTVVTNPPDEPSAEAISAMKSLEGQSE